MPNLEEQFIGKPVALYGDEGKKRRVVGEITGARLADEGDKIFVQIEISDDTLKKFLTETPD